MGFPKLLTKVSGSYVPDMFFRIFFSEVNCKLCYQTDLFHRETALKMVRSMTLLAELTLKNSKLWWEEARLLKCRKTFVPTAFRMASGKSSDREVSGPQGLKKTVFMLKKNQSLAPMPSWLMLGGGFANAIRFDGDFMYGQAKLSQNTREHFNGLEKSSDTKRF